MYKRQVYEVSANTSDYTINNVTSGGSYDVCVTTSGSDRACVTVVLPGERTTTTSPAASLIPSIKATSTSSALQVTWDIGTSGNAQIVQFRLTWQENGTSNDVSTMWMDRANTSYTISGLRASTIYLVCVQAVDEAGRIISNTTTCNYFTTQPDTDTDDLLFIIIIAASAGAFLLLLLLIIIVCCCCCCRRRHDDAPTKTNVTVRPTESILSVNRGSLAHHHSLTMNIYENIAV